jgi:glycogen phosphorylase
MDNATPVLEAQIAYFSMEIGLDPRMPTYAGGLGILAGDTVRSAADMGIPLIAVTLLPRKGYFRQRIDAAGNQHEEPADWAVEQRLVELPERICVEIESRPVSVRAWRFDVVGVGGHCVPVLLLDTDLEGNAEVDRTLTHHLYGGDTRYRLAQEAVLGIGGIRMLRALGHRSLRRYHMNEGHASLLVLALLAEQATLLGDSVIGPKHADAIRPLCVFTTHTPVPAGHDQFPIELVTQVLGPYPPLRDRADEIYRDGVLNLTDLALNNSHYVNGVAKRHREVSQQMFANYRIDSITNGVHVATWACAPMRALFDRYIPGWREDNASLRYAVSIPHSEIWSAHLEAKHALLECVRARGHAMDPGTLTIGFARRFTEYKRPELLFSDLERLQQIHAQAGPLQVVLAGKAHPRDQRGKALIRAIHDVRQQLQGRIEIAYLEEYDMELARLLVAGVDLWLNTPQPPLEASGTSGMKAAVNGVPSLSVLDGWWIEGCIEGITGWAIGDDRHGGDPASHVQDASALYDKLQRIILPTYYGHRDQYVDVMRNAMAVNGSFFNTERMLHQYITRAYFL